jgi:hypothetical protein
VTLFTVGGITLPLCDKAYNFKLQVKSATFDVESGTGVIPLGTFKAEDLLFTNTLLSSTTKTGEINRIEIDFSHSSIIRKDSVLYIKLNDKISYLSSSTCTVSGAEPTSSCALSAIAGTLRVSRAFESSQRPPGSPIKIILQGVENPKAVGSYSIDITVASIEDCVYMKGTTSLTIDLVTTMLQAAFTPRSSFLNIFDGYTFSIKPSSTTSIKAGDFFHIQVPATMMVSEAVSCTRVTNNLLSVSCSRVSQNILKADFALDSANYALNKEISFSANFVMSPDQTGSSTGVDIFLKESTGGTYQQLKNVVFNFQGVSTSNPSEISFSSDLKGRTSELTLTVKPAHYIEPGSSIVIQYSDKFDLTESSLVSSSPSVLNQPLTNIASRQIKLQVRHAIQPDTSIKFTIFANNPGTDSISISDLSLLVFNPLDKVSFTTFPLTQPKSFKCDPVCLSCSRLHSFCYYMHLRPVPPSRRPVQRSPCNQFQDRQGGPIHLPQPRLSDHHRSAYLRWILQDEELQFQLHLLPSKVQLHYSPALLPSLLLPQPDHTAVLMGIILIAIVAHILHSVLGRHIMSQMTDFGSDEASFKWCRKKEVSPKQAQLKSTRISLLQTYHKLSFFFSTGILRYFYSNSLGNKGFFWYYEPTKFSRIKSMLFRLGLVYMALIICALLVASIVYFTRIEFFAFLLELFILSCIDVLSFCLAIIELSKSDSEIKEFKGYLDKANKTEIDGILSSPFDDTAKDPANLRMWKESLHGNG